ncbi:LysE family translocator [Pacificibacter marinus]|uniref:LysE family translocator n=1 Tax=Pacificibacter marinus TaxID=658057 RepID=UPI00339D5384
MIPFSDLWPILLGWAIAVGSPGPAVLAIAGASMGSGRKNGLALAFGVWNGSMIWACIAALGFGAVMVSNTWVFETLRYLGAGYLLYLAFKSAKSALRSGIDHIATSTDTTQKAWQRGFLIHVMNPKAAFFWGALFAVVIPQGAAPIAVAQVAVSCLLTSLVVMSFMALLFSTRIISNGYLRMHRLFDGAFATLFGYAALKVVTSKLV